MFGSELFHLELVLLILEVIGISVLFLLLVRQGLEFFGQNMRQFCHRGSRIGLFLFQSLFHEVTEKGSKRLLRHIGMSRILVVTDPRSPDPFSSVGNEVSERPVLSLPDLDLDPLVFTVLVRVVLESDCYKKFRTLF